MTQYIDKSAVMTEIEKRIRRCTTVNTRSKESDAQYRTKCHTLMSILSFIDTLGVKDVDLEKEINKYICDNFFGSQTMGFFANRTKEEPNDQDIALCAKHFFELGLKALVSDNKI